MTDARMAFHELRAQAGAAYDARALHADLDAVEHRVERARVWRSALLATSLVALAGIAVLVVRLSWVSEAGPIGSPSATPAATSSATDAWPAWCHPAQVVSGKPVGDLAGFEGWFNSTPDAPCDEWDQQIKDHPDTVQINTMDNTMIEAYYRTTIDALGVYGTLDDSFAVPDPDPSWPADSAVLIDPRTGEVLASEPFADMEGFDVTAGHFESAGPS